MRLFLGSWSDCEKDYHKRLGKSVDVPKRMQYRTPSGDANPGRTDCPPPFFRRGAPRYNFARQKSRLTNQAKNMKIRSIVARRGRTRFHLSSR